MLYVEQLTFPKCLEKDFQAELNIPVYKNWRKLGEALGSLIMDKMGEHLDRCRLVKDNQDIYKGEAMLVKCY